MFGARRGRLARHRLLLAIYLVTCVSAVHAAELRFPSRSPRASVTQWVGLTNITVGYESPAVGGRKVWGSLVTPGALWLIGDSAAPTISFSRDVTIAGALVPAGAYALLAIPSQADWTVILTRQTRVWRADQLDPSAEVARVTALVEAAPHRERLAFQFSDFTDERVTLDLEWERLRVRIPIELHTEVQIAGQLRALDESWKRYAQAAWLALLKKDDLQAGLRYADQSIALHETRTNTWIKASLLAAEGDYRQASVQAGRALRMERTVGDELTNEREIAEALSDWDARARQKDRSAEAPGHSAERPDVRVARRAPDTSTIVVGGDTLSGLPLGGERPVAVAAPHATKPPSDNVFAPLIKRGLPDLRRCYQRALRQDPGLAARRITLSIAIGPSGHVRKVTVDPPLATDALDACLKTAIGRWTFPPAPGDYETQVPLVLSGRS